MTDAADLYETDFYAWRQRQARELRRFAGTRPNVSLDLRHLAEEVADLGRSERAALRSWTRRIIEHMLLLEHSLAQAPRGYWAGKIVVFRNDLEDRLSQTLRRDLRRRLPRFYGDARRAAARKMADFGEKAAIEQLPEDCPYTLQQVLTDWWPDDQRDG